MLWYSNVGFHWRNKQQINFSAVSHITPLFLRKTQGLSGHTLFGWLRRWLSLRYSMSADRSAVVVFFVEESLYLLYGLKSNCDMVCYSNVCILILMKRAWEWLATLFGTTHYVETYVILCSPGNYTERRETAYGLLAFVFMKAFLLTLMNIFSLVRVRSCGEHQSMVWAYSKLIYGKMWWKSVCCCWCGAISIPFPIFFCVYFRKILAFN